VLLVNGVQMLLPNQKIWFLLQTLNLLEIHILIHSFFGVCKLLSPKARSKRTLLERVTESNLKK